jgi:hypothetical protein
LTDGLSERATVRVFAFLLVVFGLSWIGPQTPFHWGVRTLLLLLLAVYADRLARFAKARRRGE